MDYKSDVHRLNADKLKNHTPLSIRNKRRSMRIQTTGTWILAKSYDTDILKVNKITGAIYFDGEHYSKTTKELQNIVEKWLDENGLQVTNRK